MSEAAGVITKSLGKLGKEGMKAFAAGMESMVDFADKAQDVTGLFAVMTDLLNIMNPFIVPIQILLAEINAETIEKSVDLMLQLIKNMQSDEFQSGMKTFTDFINVVLTFFTDLAAGNFDDELDNITKAFESLVNPLGTVNNYLDYFEEILVKITTAFQEFLDSAANPDALQPPDNVENIGNFFAGMWKVLEEFFGGAPDVGGQPGFGGSY